MRYLDLRIAHAPGGSARNLCFVHMMYTKTLVEVWAPGREREQEEEGRRGMRGGWGNESREGG